MVRRERGGYDVTIVVHDHEDRRPGGGPARAPTRAQRLVLSAGTLGSNWLLLVNQAAALGVTSPTLGPRFSGNGDLLRFILGAAGALEGSRGPVISA